MISINTMRVFCDTSFFYASIDPKDENHEKAKEINHTLIEKKLAIYTTQAIIIETITLLRYRFSYQGALKFIKQVKPNLNIVDLDDNLYSSDFKKNCRTAFMNALQQLWRDKIWDKTKLIIIEMADRDILSEREAVFQKKILTNWIHFFNRPKNKP